MCQLIPANLGNWPARNPAGNQTGEAARWQHGRHGYREENPVPDLVRAAFDTRPVIQRLWWVATGEQAWRQANSYGVITRIL